MKANKIKVWARIGQAAFFAFILAGGLFEAQLPGYVPIEFSNTLTEAIYAVVAILCFFILSEAIVRLICYFAELLEKEK